jgi:hypothetical protein
VRETPSFRKPRLPRKQPDTDAAVAQPSNGPYRRKWTPHHETRLHPVHQVRPDHKVKHQSIFLTLAILFRSKKKRNPLSKIPPLSLATKTGRQEGHPSKGMPKKFDSTNTTSCFYCQHHSFFGNKIVQLLQCDMRISSHHAMGPNHNRNQLIYINLIKNPGGNITVYPNRARKLRSNLFLLILEPRWRRTKIILQIR